MELIKHRNKKLINIAAWLSFGCLFLTFIVSLIEKIIKFPVDDWDHNRLVPIFAFKLGYKYINAYDTGPVLSWAYGPISPIFFFPSTLTNSPTTATMIGGIINILILFLPFLVVATFYIRKSRLMFFYGLQFLLITFFYVVNNQALEYTAFDIHVDSPSLSLGAISCLLIYFSFITQDDQKNLYLISFAGVTTVLAIWAKHNLILLPLAIITYLIITGKFKIFKLYLISLIGSGIFFSLIIIAIFSHEYLFFSMVESMAKQPNVLKNFNLSVAKLSSVNRTLLRASLELLTMIWPFALIILSHVVITVKKGKYSNLNTWLIYNPYSLFFITFFYMIPLAIASRIKWGGNINSLSIAIYFMVLAAFIMFIEVVYKNQANGIKRVINIQKILTIIVVFAIFCSQINYLKSSPKRINTALNNLQNNNLEVSFQYMLKNPNQVYFPDYPLSSAMAERKIYHSIKGLNDREAGRLRLTAQHFQQYIPSKMKYIAFADPENKWQKERIEIMKSYLPQYSQKITIKDLPGWLVYKLPES
ncbi:MAG: hypothetical protein F6K23_34055 [Okeania sp. SIO2C9]|uniref:hypothetical protein n=1 Tax=Okeania sp. SIO2C9 TaxID=2607791 RepID=UPI0013C05E2A|nr:hypothetical protein [Okeania sp. SIO2C9]NEQ77600.1 hypothetical protein [Okeania sp. SIO2C9]